MGKFMQSLMKFNVSNFQFSFIVVLLMVITFTTAQSQVDLKLGGGIGVMSTVSDFNGSTLQYYNGKSYGQNSGLNLQGKAKIGLGGLNLVGGVDYTSLQNTGNSEPGQGFVDVSQKIISLKVGPEFHLTIPLLPLVPYFGANLAFNTFSGETTFRGVSKVPSATYSIKDATRLGVGFSVGTEISVGPLLSLDFNASYNFMNVSGSEWNDVNPGVNQRIDSYLSLNDSADPEYAAGDDKHFILNDRSINSVLFTVSILFGL
jgi:hypothetical protein